ncbi:MAG: LPXTG cell wall anchor domain-containing protein [Acutalibacteraceae bacterium]|nr:LPXTG cell wall anchor domain-containing protein [Acutalibacteraceae bacterium]
MKNKLMSILTSVLMLIAFVVMSVVNVSAYQSGITNTGDSTTTIMVIMGALMVVAVITIIVLSRKK